MTRKKLDYEAGIMFDTALDKAASKSKWVHWLINDNKHAARSTLNFLNTCFANIHEAKHPGICKKLKCNNKDGVEATICELVAHELLRRLELSPEFEFVSVDGLKPDLSFATEGKRFLTEVYLTHSPSKTYRDFKNRMEGEAWDTSKPDESRAHKIEDVLSEKISKYKCLDMPLVVFVFLGDHRGLSESDVETALFGMTAKEVSLEKRFPESVSRECIPVGGLLLPDEDGNNPYCNLSAVVSCDWFDTLNRQDRGKRLHCLVLHNWGATEALPIDAFKPFPQIIWSQSEPGIWKPRLTKNRTIVAKFTNDGGIEYREYTPNTAW